ncbi:MAG: helix-turn-helix domain-containing protein [Clostridia bacterium]|nr:helix-turn-helix domain-containing protein [Clostridia bacterium]
MDILSNFAENLSELIFDNNLTPKDFSKDINIVESVTYRYLRKVCLPSLQNAVNIADYFKCSTDYLFGLTESNEKAEFKKAPPFNQRFKEMLNKNKLSRYAFRKVTHFAQQSVDDWYHGTRTPSVQNAILIAKYFDCTLDFLIGREN